jgi:pyrroline-5-carboxylate reductase
MVDLQGVTVGIIGAGAIGGVVIDRLLGAGSRAEQIVACEPKDTRREEIGKRFGVRVTADPAEAARCNIVVLAAPPMEIRKILQAIGGQLGHRPVIVSFAGAVPLAVLEAELSSVPVVRVNPNSPSVVGAGYNPVAYGSKTVGAARELVDRFLGLLGSSPLIRDSEMNLYTALTAVGPTYFLPVFDAMIAAGMASGLSQKAAVSAAVETARGTAEMVANRPELPEQLKLFTGLRPLQDASVRDLVAKAISDALARMESVQKQVAS